MKVIYRRCQTGQSAANSPPSPPSHQSLRRTNATVLPSDTDIDYGSVSLVGKTRVITTLLVIARREWGNRTRLGKRVQAGVGTRLRMNSEP